MESNSWLIIMSICFFIMTLTFVAVIVFILFAAIELRKASIALREFLGRTEEKMQPLLQQSESTLASLRKVSEDVRGVSGNVRLVSDSVAEFGANIRAANALLGEVQNAVTCRASGLRAGLSTALSVFMGQLRSGR
ncbi:MAG TPA: DUF948 domain-containing protein [Dissulfurispiraceae bacterium]|nr:DUF948 domain-containing protein [Dissulfurispiraceae bacterium]